MVSANLVLSIFNLPRLYTKLFLFAQMNKGNDINDAMKYRAAKEKPKLVEVWISKIHRNGLFALQT